MSDTPPDPPPVGAQTLNLRDVYDLVEQLRAAVRTIVCSPDEAPVVQAAFVGTPLVVVQASELVPPGTAYLVGPPDLVTIDVYLRPAVLAENITLRISPEGWGS